MSSKVINPLDKEIRYILDTSRGNVVRDVDNELIRSYWKIGKIIIRYEQSDSIRTEYGGQTLKQFSKELTSELGIGFSRSNLQNMKDYYLNYEKCQTLSGKLNWSSYCELLSMVKQNIRLLRRSMR